MIQFKKNNNLSKNTVFDAKKDTTISLTQCIKCSAKLEDSKIIGSLGVCFYCGYHFKQPARQRIESICDKDSFVELNSNIVSANILDFPDYCTKLENARKASQEEEAVVCGLCTIKGFKVAIFVMEPNFMLGSMGIVVGEKITDLFEHALENELPVVGFTVSGGARMQEGILSLMQMAKISGAVKRHSDAGHLYLCILTNPTTGGVTASFAMGADIILAEPFALIGFAGPRVIEQTTRNRLPEGFQQSDFILEKGFVDDIVERKAQKKYIAKALLLHSYRKELMYDSI
ncbi:MAG: acetyl-CoA carboxylase carboxyl transferase subunit beta [Defluviitaleaceae bacterium]|nr:acetyl-CoA carboxylase carboxyl transferase subunit beta [Defluviitaleaceae bacterium]